MAENIKVDFRDYHIPKVWKELNDRFGFNISAWKKRFEQSRIDEAKRRTGRDHDLTSDFYYFGNTQINPVINQILGRREHHGTFNRLIEYVVNGKVVDP
jgi:hypothetical protein